MRFDRRQFLGGLAAAGTLATGAVLTGCDDEQPPVGVDGDNPPPAAPEPPREQFVGKNQMGILPGTSAYGIALALDVTATTITELEDLLRQISGIIAQSTTQPAPDPEEPLAVPVDNGILAGTDALLTSGTLSAGASLFDARFGLAELKPKALTQMPPGLAREELDPLRSDGDLMLLVQAEDADVCTAAIRRVVRECAGLAKPKWLLEVFTRPDTTPEADRTTTRNLLGFKDGTGNPDSTLDELMREVVWSAGEVDDEPMWCAGGTYVAARTSRMLVEQWDAQTLDHQEKIFGRAKVSGAPLDGETETDVPIYPQDPGGQKIPLTAHIRLANPRDGKALLMLRRSMSYTRGLDAEGLLDQGLFFLSYQRTMPAFLEAQQRLKGEPMEQFVIVEGGGFYFAFPGPPEDGYLGKQLIDALEALAENAD